MSSKNWPFQDGIDPFQIFSPEAFEGMISRWGGVLLDYIKTIHNNPVMRWATPAKLEGILKEDSFETGVSGDHLLKRFQEDILPWCQNHLHPKVAGHMVGCPLPVAVASDLAASLLNQGMGIWEVSPGPVLLSQQVISWFIRMAGFDSKADGILTTGGSEANLTALLAARSSAYGPEIRETGIRREDQPLILASEMAHYSIARAAGMIGIGRRQVRGIPVGKDFRMDPRALVKEFEQAVTTGRRVVAVVATAGTTAAGTFDPIEEIAGICSRFGAWLHVDGAHGASLLLTDKYRQLLDGVQRAHSLTWDPHKMLFMPSALGILLVADGRDLAAVFDDRPTYLFGRRAEDEPEWNFTRKNFRCTQRFDALRLWAALRFHGRSVLGKLVERTKELALFLWESLKEDPRFEPLLEPPFNVVCFRFVPANFQGTEEDLNNLNEEIRTKLLRDGSAWITTTVLKKRLFLRAVIMNPAASERDMSDLLLLAGEAGKTLAKKSL